MGLFDYNKKKSSGNYAKDRLRNLLVSDKTNYTNDVINQLEDDILEVISRYFEIDTSDYQFQILQSNQCEDTNITPVLNMRIPIKNMNIKTIK